MYVGGTRTSQYLKQPGPLLGGGGGGDSFDFTFFTCSACSNG